MYPGEFPAVLGATFGLFYVTYSVKAITCTVTIREVNIGRKTNVNLLATLITAISLQILGPSNVLTSYFDDHGKRVVQRPRRVGLFKYCYQA
jgi:hypothetical protein